MTVRLEPLPTEEYAAWREAATERRARRRSIPMAGGDRAAGLAEEWAITDRVFPGASPGERHEVLSVVGDAGLRGVVALVWDNDTDVAVFDLDLSDAADGEGVHELVADRVRNRGAASLAVRVAPGDDVASAFASVGGFEVMATTMLLDLSAVVPETAAPSVELRPMTPDELDAYVTGGIEGFADELMAAAPGLTRDDAVAESRRTHEQILPDGAATPGHDFLVATDADGHRAGHTWLHVDGPKAFVYDVEVDADRRGQGYGRALMLAAADHSRDRGAAALDLNVFGHNQVARGLYVSLGYAVVDEAWRSRL